MIIVTPSIRIEESELEFVYIRASGPGGQNVNKVSTAVQLRFDIRSSTLPEGIKERISRLAGNRISKDGILILEAKRSRTQEQNREDAIERFIELVRKASLKPKSRKKTQPTAASREKRLQSKKTRSRIKQVRSTKHFDQD